MAGEDGLAAQRLCAVLQGDFPFLKLFWEEAAVAAAPWAHGHCLQPSWVFYFEPRGLLIPQETF